MISALEQRRRTTTDLVFTREYTRGDGPPKLIRQIDKRDFARACRATGMVDFHWHDLRHTWASWHVQHGTPLMVLKELGGLEDDRDGAEVCAPRAKPPRAARRHCQVSVNVGRRGDKNAAVEGSVSS